MSETLLSAALEPLAAIAAIVALAWLAERAVPRRPALRAAIWTAALVAVTLTPALTAAGRLLPWRVGLLPGERLAPLPAAVEWTPPIRVEPPRLATPTAAVRHELGRRFSTRRQ